MQVARRFHVRLSIRLVHQLHSCAPESLAGWLNPSPASGGSSRGAREMVARSFSPQTGGVLAPMMVQVDAEPVLLHINKSA